MFASIACWSPRYCSPPPTQPLQEEIFHTQLEMGTDLMAHHRCIRPIGLYHLIKLSQIRQRRQLRLQSIDWGRRPLTTKMQDRLLESSAIEDAQAERGSLEPRPQRRRFDPRLLRPNTERAACVLRDPYTLLVTDVHRPEFLGRQSPCWSYIAGSLMEKLCLASWMKLKRLCSHPEREGRRSGRRLISTELNQDTQARGRQGDMGHGQTQRALG